MPSFMSKINLTTCCAVLRYTIGTTYLQHCTRIATIQHAHENQSITSEAPRSASISSCRSSSSSTRTQLASIAVPMLARPVTRRASGCFFYNACHRNANPGLTKMLQERAKGRDLRNKVFITEVDSSRHGAKSCPLHLPVGVVNRMRNLAQHTFQIRVHDILLAARSRRAGCRNPPLPRILRL